MRMHPLWLALALAGLTCFPMPARAAQSYDNCAGFIDSVPATITAQGTWCLRKDLSTAITSGAAIIIATNNVTIDCNHFKLGGLQAGDSSGTSGIRGDNRLNTTVRHCNIRGFRYGIQLSGGGHLIEDNRLDQNLYTGIAVFGDNNTVRRNAVYDTGGLTGNAYAYGIYAFADVIDNTVSGVFATASTTYPHGIFIQGSGSEARGNRVRGLVEVGTGHALGIFTESSGVTVDGNRITAAAFTTGWGIVGFNDTFCRENTVAQFSLQIEACRDSGGNDVY